MHKLELLAGITSLLLYTCKADSGITDSVLKADDYPQYIPPVFYPYFPTDNQLKKASPYPKPQQQRPFGGDRSDRWLYPPRSYYLRWAASEEQRDWDKWDQWQNWQGQPMQPQQ